MKPIALPAEPDPDPFFDPISLAITAEMVERGYACLTVAGVARRAGVSVEEFHRRFVDLDHCVLDTYERQTADFKRSIGEAFNRHSDWRSAIRAAAYATADWLESHSEAARFGAIEILQVRNEMARVLREEAFFFYAEMIERGKEAAPDPRAVPEGAAIFAVGSIFQIYVRRLREGAEIRFPEDTREALYGVVLTYLGEDAAREELSLPGPMAAAVSR